MQRFSIFLGDEAGVFGAARDVWMVDEAEALVLGRRLLASSPRVDIWTGARCVGQLTRLVSEPPSGTSIAQRAFDRHHVSAKPRDYAAG